MDEVPERVIIFASSKIKVKEVTKSLEINEAECRRNALGS